MLPRTTSPISWAMMPVMVWTGCVITARPAEKSGMAMRLPAQSNTTIVSPMTRPRPSNTAEIMPDSEAGTMIFTTVCRRVAPRASDASL